MADPSDLEQAWTVLMGDRRIPRWTQDSPIRPSVWAEFLSGAKNVSLLMTPVREVSAGQLFKTLTSSNGGPRVIYNQSTVACHMSFHEMLEYALPKSKWWKDVGRAEMRRCAKITLGKKSAQPWNSVVKNMAKSDRRTPLRSSFYYFVLVIGIIEARSSAKAESDVVQLASLARGAEDKEDEVVALRAECLAKGYGLLRDAIREYLRTVDVVQSFNDEQVDMGGSGITVVKLSL